MCIYIYMYITVSVIFFNELLLEHPRFAEEVCKLLHPRSREYSEYHFFLGQLILSKYLQLLR